jgi:D-inositol-3-phosphate glycosyltransferase
LPTEKFLIFLSSRISHEKDPETVLKATALVRKRGLDAVLINLGGGYKEFLALARKLGLADCDDWVLGRPAEHPMGDLADYFRCADAVALASLAEGAAYSTLEGLACGTPVVATAVGGMAVQLKGFANLTKPQDPESMADAFLAINAHPELARSQARLGREHVIAEWDSKKAFSDLKQLFATLVDHR